MEKEEALTPPRRVIKHKGTGRFYAGEGRWVKDLGQAKDFGSVWLMVEEGMRYGLRGQCVLLLDFGVEELDIEIEL